MDPKIKIFRNILISSAFFASSVSAHTFGAHGAGFAEGMAHPFIGLDHLLAMIAVGLWATQLGGRALWGVPLAFVSVMVGGTVLANQGFELAFVEAMIAISVVILGLMVAGSVRVSTGISVLTVSVFALFHGYAHGLEMPQAGSPLAYMGGFILATTTLHLVGIAMGLSLKTLQGVSWLSGTAIAVAGVYLLASL